MCALIGVTVDSLLDSTQLYIGPLCEGAVCAAIGWLAGLARAPLTDI